MQMMTAKDIWLQRDSPGSYSYSIRVPTERHTIAMGQVALNGMQIDTT